MNTFFATATSRGAPVDPVTATLCNAALVLRVSPPETQSGFPPKSWTLTIMHRMSCSEEFFAAITASKTNGLQVLQLDDCNFVSEKGAILPSMQSHTASLTNLFVITWYWHAM